MIRPEHADEMQLEPRKYGVAWKHEAIAQCSRATALTAEVERLTKQKEEAVAVAKEAIDAMEALCSGHDDCPLNHEAMEDRAARLAALSLPAPEAKE